MIVGALSAIHSIIVSMEEANELRPVSVPKSGTSKKLKPSSPKKKKKGVREYNT